MIDFTNARVESAAVHRVENRTNEGQLLEAKELLELTDDRLGELLLKSFQSQFSDVEFYEFGFSGGNVHLNPVYHYTIQAFDAPNTFLKQTVDIARHLYQVATHPQIKPGDLFVVYMEGLVIDGYNANAIGLFKSEVPLPFMKLLEGGPHPAVSYEEGIDPGKLDKSCLILDMDRDTGLKVCVKDNSRATQEAQYWKDDFLYVKPCKDEYHFTKNFLDVTKEYVTKQLPEETHVERTDQIDLLNRSINYFKDNDHFERAHFETEVLQEPELVSSFRKFDEAYRGELELPDTPDFSISKTAVKKQQRVYKSVIKLDKNFHIYVHGQRDRIERGYDEERGLKYYKVYYEEER